MEDWKATYKMAPELQREATLKFALPDHQHEFDCALNGEKYSTALWEVYQHLRSKHKFYNGDSEEIAVMLYSIYDEVLRIMDENGYNPFDED